MKKIFIFTVFLLSTFTMTAQTPEQKLVQQAIFGMFDGRVDGERLPRERSRSLENSTIAFHRNS